MRHLISTTLFVFMTAVLFAVPNGFIYHTVEKGETLYSISRQYGLKPQEVAQYNETVGEKLTIRVGQKLKIPSTEPTSTATTPSTTRAAAPATPEAKSSESFHVVQKGETVFSISKMYSISKNDLLSWNKIKDYNISMGQKLLIKTDGNTSSTPAEKPRTAPAAHSTEPAIAKSEVEKAMKKDGYAWTLPESGKTTNKTNVSTASGDVTASASSAGVSDNKVVKTWKAESTSDLRDYYKSKPSAYDPANEYESLYYQNVYAGMVKKTETGVAKFLTDNNTANTAYYNNAPIGTILKLTNADNGKSTYAIVVGKIPAAEQNSYLMKLSGKVARNLAAKDYTSIEIVCYTEN
jgi:LysM repeat protein